MKRKLADYTSIDFDLRTARMTKLSRSSPLSNVRSMTILYIYAISTLHIQSMPLRKANL
jgi:hypothetical protein